MSLWKANWEQTRKHFIDWWNHEGLVVGQWDPKLVSKKQHENACKPDAATSIEQRHIDATWRPLHNHHKMSWLDLPLDMLPIAEVDIGPGSLCLYLGCEPDFAEDTVWYQPCINELEKYPPLGFDQTQKWWKVQESLITSSINLSKGRYFVGCPDLAEGIDILASLRGTENLLMDMLVKPDAVMRRLDEIHQSYQEIYEQIYNLIKMDDGGMVFRAFCLWAPGRVAKVQCDTAAMISPEMFQKFVIPDLTKQCDWLDYSMFHLDGTQCIHHLEYLLGIDSLDAVEWTPQAGIPGGADKRWHDMYKYILSAGKSIQLVGIKPVEIMPLLDAIGTKGVYILAEFSNEKECEDVSRVLENFR